MKSKMIFSIFFILCLFSLLANVYAETDNASDKILDENLVSNYSKAHQTTIKSTTEIVDFDSDVNNAIFVYKSKFDIKFNSNSYNGSKSKNVKQVADFNTNDIVIVSDKSFKENSFDLKFDENERYFAGEDIARDFPEADLEFSSNHIGDNSLCLPETVTDSGAFFFNSISDGCDLNLPIKLNQMDS